jgi:hypothetical protein
MKKFSPYFCHYSDIRVYDSSIARRHYHGTGVKRVGEGYTGVLLFRPDRGGGGPCERAVTNTPDST